MRTEVEKTQEKERKAAERQRIKDEKAAEKAAKALAAASARKAKAKGKGKADENLESKEEEEEQAGVAAGGATAASAAPQAVEKAEVKSEGACGSEACGEACGQGAGAGSCSVPPTCAVSDAPAPAVCATALGPVAMLRPPPGPLDSLAPSAPCKTTLVICPVVALTQWRSEILKHTAPHSLSVLIYHGANREKGFGAGQSSISSGPLDLTQYDVVLTSYSVLEAEYRRMVAPMKVVCQWCRKAFMPEKLPIHLRYFCGPDAQRTDAQAKQERRRPQGRGRTGAGSDDEDGEGGDEDEEGEDADSEDGGADGAGGKENDSRTWRGSDAFFEGSKAATPGSKGAPAKKGAASASKAGGKQPAAASTASQFSITSSSRRTLQPAASAPIMVHDSSSPTVSAGDDESDTDGGAARAGRAGVKRRRPAVAEGDREAGKRRRVSSGTARAASKGPAKQRGAKPQRRPRGRRWGGSSDEGSDSDSEFNGGDSSDCISIDSSSSEAEFVVFDSDVEEVIKKSPPKKSGKAAGAAPGSSTPSSAPAPASGKKRAASGVSPAGGASAPAKPAAPATVRLGPISPLLKIHYRRLIIDEAHAIKNQRSNTARAVFAIKAERKWALSGTPLQNRVAEMFSLVRFLVALPYAAYYCKNCPCQSLDYRFDNGGRTCHTCGHSPLRHYHWLNKYVLNPIKAYGVQMGPGKAAMSLFRREVLDSILLRRTKAGRAADLSLPGRTQYLRNDLELDAYEDDFYRALYTQTKARFGAYVSQGTLLSNYAHLFDLLTRLRQAVNHPYLILYGQTNILQAAGEGAGAALNDVCGICRESAEDPVLTGCGHAFCRLCMRTYLETLGGRALGLLRDRTLDDEDERGGDIVDVGDDTFADEEVDDEDDMMDFDEEQGGYGRKPKKATPATLKTGSGTGRKNTGRSVNSSAARSKGASPGAQHDASDPNAALPTCPTCFAPLSVDLTAAPVSASAVGSGMTTRRHTILARIPPSRVGRAFQSSTKIEALLENLWRAQETDPGSKALVFSQYVNFLQLIEYRLTLAGIRCVRLDGGMSVQARDRVIHGFRDDPDITVFLVSLKAGGVALNLVSASSIHLMDAWWNPAVPAQAMDRTHRLGQYRSVSVYTYVMKGTVEEKVLQLQDKKRTVFNATVGQDTASMGKLTEDDIRFLFS
jgi:SNF2 family DNA or RNA helicase